MEIMGKFEGRKKGTYWLRKMWEMEWSDRKWRKARRIVREEKRCQQGRAIAGRERRATVDEQCTIESSRVTG